jgi:hypothetical protein
MLLDIAQSRLPDAEFTFLSCCHVVEITEESVTDEAPYCCDAVLWIPKCCWDYYVGNGRYRWARPGQDILQVTFL